MSQQDRGFVRAFTASLIAATLTMAVVSPAHAQSPVTPPGSGTLTDPYLISELGHLAWMSNYTGINVRAKYYSMTTDIDASATAGWNDAGTDTDILEGFKPIGTSTTFFGGTFDGNGHTITGLVINRPAMNDVGIFGYLGTAGKVRNLGVIDTAIKGASNVGGLVGCNLGAASNAYVVGAITGTGSVVGGLVGNHSGALSNCSNCYAAGTVTGQGNAIGGLIGGNSGKVSICFATNTVAGQGNAVGGLIGANSGTLSNCFATGAATTTATESSVGGLVGNQAGTIANCYATGMVTGLSETGGLVGAASAGTVSNSYWDVQTSGQDTSVGGTGKTSAQMKQQATWTGWDFATVWNIAEGASYPYLRYSPPPFRLTIKVAGPGTVTVDPASADGTYAPGTLVTLTATPTTNIDEFSAWSGASPSDSRTVTVVLDIHKAVSALFIPGIEISSVADLAMIGNDPDYPLANVSYRLTADIDASATATWNDAGTSTGTPEGFKPIGSSATPFSGIFEGNRHTITGLTINRPHTDDIGLFGSVGTTGQVRNLNLIGGAISGAKNVGGLVGSNSGAISNCSATSAITGWHRGGGMVGVNFGTVSKCYATGKVIGMTDCFGGLVGETYGSVSDCHADGNVDGGWLFVGGLVGLSCGTLSHCHATGTVTGAGGYFGGLVGRNYSGTVSNCHATGAVTRTSMSSATPIGGLVGGNTGTVSNSYATGAVTNTGMVTSVGGLIGANSGTVSRCFTTSAVTGNTVGGLAGNNSGTVSDCFATGPVTGMTAGYSVGGLVGYNSGAVSKCYATGVPIGAKTKAYVGGLVGNSDEVGTTSSSYWDIQTSGFSTSDGGTGKTTAQMKQQTTFTNWDFTNTWRIVDNLTYPYLRSPADHGDFNRDGFVDRSDLDAFAPCITGPAIRYDPASPPSNCTLPPVVGLLPADLDADGDVDQSDFGIFQRCWSGSNRPADPGCNP